MDLEPLRRMAAVALLLPVLGYAAGPPVAVHTVKTDLKPLIGAAAGSPVQFAVLVPHEASTSDAGSWSEAGRWATWRYAVRVPTAVSLSFHAINSALPPGSALIVRGARTTTSYTAKDVHRNELWSRIHPGEALDLTLTVPVTDRAKVTLQIVSLQAGYRGLGPGVGDHPYYRQLKQRAAAASGNAACVTNYACAITPANTPAGSATVALIIEGLYQCSGTLINDVPNDNTPFILTARHCESGQVGAIGNPSAAIGTTVYWDATSSCGAALGSIYDSGIPTQTGAQTLVEQQDAWLIQLDASPVVSDAQFAGFDASGGAVQGGYTVQHAEGFDKQYTAWFGQAASVPIFTGYANFLEAVNQTGNIGPGASGSALMDQNNHLVGSLTYGRRTSDPSGYEACPAPNPVPPDGSNGVADFTALASVWASTSDPNSRTGTTTIRQILDPANTGTLIVPSAPAAVITLSASTETITFGQPLQLTWNAPGATQCTAGGGAAGDGWSGTLAAAGTQSLTELAPSVVTYTLTCAYSAGRSAKTATTVDWVPLAAQVQFHAPFELWTTRPAVLSWTSNVGPCSISGGSLSLTNLPDSGITTTTEVTAGDVTYTLSCGPPNNNETLANLVHYVTPSLTFEANGTDRLLGQTFFLQWLTYADSCTPSGGAPNDGWANSAFNANFSVQQFSPQVAAAGTYSYTLTCSSGPISLQQTVTVTFENNAPFVTASASATSVVFSDSPADYVTLTWNSNLSTCSFASTPNLPIVSNASSGPFGSLPLPQGTLTIAPFQSGTYVMSVTCSVPTLNSTSVTSSPITLIVAPPAPPTVSISFSPSTVLAGENFTVAWSSTDALNCNQSGGIPGGTWGQDPAPQPPAGSVVEAAVPGQFTFGISCQSIDPQQAAVTTQASLSIVALQETLTANATTVTVGDSFTLTWSTVGATNCTAHGGGANGVPWSGSLPSSGSVTQTATTTGNFTYELDCGDANLMIAQQVAITVKAASGGGPTGGGGGGGSLSMSELALLALWLLRARNARRQAGDRHGEWCRRSTAAVCTNESRPPEGTFEPHDD